MAEGSHTPGHRSPCKCCFWLLVEGGSQKKHVASLGFTLTPGIPWLTVAICSYFAAFTLPSAEGGGRAKEFPKAGCARGSLSCVATNVSFSIFIYSLFISPS